MIKRFPHTLQYMATANDAPAPARDANGNWIVADNANNPVSIACRAEPNGTGRTITGADGMSVSYSWTIYAGKVSVNLAVGDEVQLYKDGQLFGHGKVLMAVSGQLSTLIYV